MLLLAIVINFVVAAFLYPEIFNHLDLRLIQGHETCGPMEYVFYLIGQFYQGGIQLFDRYYLLNTSFAQLSVGLYTPINFIIAGGYVLLSPFVSDPAQFFHHWYVVAYYGIGLTLRTFGVYILAFYMTKSRLVAIITSVLVNCFCAITLIHMGGLCISEVYNYLPLLLFCLVYYWDTRSFKAIIAAVLVFLLAANNGLYVGFGYFYQTLHLFLFDMLMIWLIFQRGRKPLLSDRFKWGSVGKVVLLTALVLLPVFWWGKNAVSDFEMYGSGLGDSQGRFHRIYNPVAMMQDPLRYFVSSADVFSHAYDFKTSGWYINGAFLGITTMILAVIGLVLSRHSYKFVFVTAAVMMGFLNVPSNQGHWGWMMWAHWIDTVTNPFCFLVRSFHYSVLLWYLTMAIPICLGLQSCMAIVQKNFKVIYVNRINFLKGVLAGILGACLFIADSDIKAYAIKILALFLLFFLAFDHAKLSTSLRIRLASIFFLAIMVIEFSVLNSYINTKSQDMNWAYWDGLRVKPRQFSYMYTSPTPMVLDYQNPRILPVRYFYRTDKHVVFPLVCEFQGIFGEFYQYLPLALRLERPSSIYVPRLKIFRDIDKDNQIQEYIQRDGRVMYMADAAIAPDQKDYDYILAAGLDRRVIQVEGAHLDKVKDISAIRLGQAIPESFKQHDYVFQLASGVTHQKSGGIEYQWPLPKDFPRYLSTSLFTPDVYLWQMSIGPKQLIPAQGDLVSPFTFDVNNIRDGYVTILVPEGTPVGKDPVTLHVWTQAELVDVWRNTEDQFGFTWNAPRDGWWVMHMPFDPKWQLFIDGVKTPISKINRYFIGAPLSMGEHKILLTYWPDSPLRPLIILSVLTAFVIMGIVFFRTYQWSQEKK